MRVLKRFVTILFLAMLISLAWAWQSYHDFKLQALVIDKPVIFEVHKGHSLERISKHLYTKIPHNRQWLKLLAYEYSLATKLKAGEYELAVGLKPLDFLLLLSQGTVRQHSITLVEGWSFKQFRQALQSKNNIDHRLQTMSNADILKKLDSQYTHVEGLFFPDTYQYEKGVTDLAILTRAYTKMQHVLAQLWSKRAKNIAVDSPYEALILASVIEKETANRRERQKISGVFSRRLQLGMRLQTDPTVIYGMGDAYQGHISKRDLRTYTPYNTYKIKGLPPTPIAMPSKESLYAALHPDTGKSLYFVAKGEQGLHQFSATLAEHNKAVNRYQR